MPIKILMPALSPTMTEGNIAKWLKKEGDKVSPGDVIAEIETDKATMEVESIEEGVLVRIIVPQGTDNVAVNSLIAVLLEEGEDISVLDNFITDNKIAKSPVEPVTTDQKTELGNLLFTDKPDHTNNIIVAANNSLQQNERKKIFASPLAKRLAAIDNISLSDITGTGPYGRIIKQDVMSYLASPKDHVKTGVVSRNSEEYKEIPNNNIRKIIAKRLLESKQTVPHFYLSVECNVDKLLDVREDINKSFVEDIKTKISVNDFIILAVAKALKAVPDANASWADSAIRYYNNVDVAVAVAIEGGLITPIVRNADQKNILALSAELQQLIKKARDNKLTPEEFQGGSFSVSNLGMYGIKNFSAIINPPQSCILAIGASCKRPVIMGDQIKIATIMDVTLSSDHRVVDGAVGAKFLTAFKKFVESPALMLI